MRIAARGESEELDLALNRRWSDTPADRTEVSYTPPSLTLQGVFSSARKPRLNAPAVLHPARGRWVACGRGASGPTVGLGCAAVLRRAVCQSIRILRPRVGISDAARLAACLATAAGIEPDGTRSAVERSDRVDALRAITAAAVDGVAPIVGRWRQARGLLGANWVQNTISRSACMTESPGAWADSSISTQLLFSNAGRSTPFGRQLIVLLRSAGVCSPCRP